MRELSARSAKTFNAVGAIDGGKAGVKFLQDAIFDLWKGSSKVENGQGNTGESAWSSTRMPAGRLIQWFGSKGTPSLTLLSTKKPVLVNWVSGPSKFEEVEQQETADSWKSPAFDCSFSSSPWLDLRADPEFRISLALSYCQVNVKLG